MNTHKVIRMVSAVLLLAVAAQADWKPGDPYKMHYPQLPDPNGWDVSWENYGPFLPEGKTLADDFKCTASGEITEVHFWVSWYQDFALWESIRNIHLSIHKDNPAGTVYPWSSPGELVWERDFLPGEWLFRPDEQFSGLQGWYDPLFQIVEPANHLQTWQINIMDIVDPFFQVEGEIYWLDIRIDQEPFSPDPRLGKIGWKTSMDHWNDDAVFDIIPEDPFINEWFEIRDPFTQESLDMAFVIVPEPNVIAMILMTAGSFIFVRRRFLI
jgi:hypothetical protein